MQSGMEEVLETQVILIMDLQLVVFLGSDVSSLRTSNPKVLCVVLLCLQIEGIGPEPADSMAS